MSGRGSVMQPKVELNFRHTYLRCFLISAVVPILAIFVILSLYYDREAVSFSREVLAGAMDAGKNALETSFAEIEQISFTPYLYKEVSQTMTYMKNGFLRPGVEGYDYLDLASLESNYAMLFTKMLHSSQQKVQAISFYPFGAALGDCYAIERDTAGLSRTQVSAAEVDRLYGYTVPHGSAPAFLSLDGDEPRQTYSLLRTIKDYDSGKELGILRIDTSLSSLAPCLVGMQVTENSALMLCDSQGQIVYCDGTVKPGLMEQAQGGADEGVLGSQRYTFQRRSPGSTGWTLFHAASVSDIRLSNAGATFLIFAVTLLAFLAAFILYRAQSANMISSIESILYAIRQLQEGNLSYVCAVKDKKELLMIADALNKTGKKLDDLIRTEAEARTSQSKAEYLALQSQINPHFLYNTLNGFIALNRLGEKQLLETSIIQLTKLFRYICSNSDVSTPAREFDFATQYLELQKLRFEERITYTVVVGEGTGDLPVPKLVIQPIVENCIVHGMEEDDEPIEIILRSYVKKSGEGQVALILEVVDTGVGFDTAKLRDSPRVGLNNVTQRLNLFREGSHYEVSSTPGRGTTARIIIPLESARQ